MNNLRTTVYGLPALASRPFEGADITYILCLVEQNRSQKSLEHYPASCERSVQDGGAEVLAWNWTSLGGTTNGLVSAWNKSEGHRHLMLGTGDQVSAGVFCIGATAYGVAWFRRADKSAAQGRTLAKKDPPGPTYQDLFGRTDFPLYGDNSYVCTQSGTAVSRSRPHSSQETDGTPPATIAAPTTLDQVIAERPDFSTEHADVLRLYQAYFARVPDLSGAIYWLDVFDDGISPGEIAFHMSASTEFKNKYGAASDRDFLITAYRNALGREPDAGGFNYWLDLLESKQLSRSETVFYVAFGGEFRTAYPFGGK